MRASRTQILLGFAASLLATFVFLSEVESTVEAGAAYLAVLGAFSLAAANTADGGGPVGSVALTLIVATGFVGATRWYNLHTYRLPPRPESSYLLIPVVAVIIGLLGYIVGTVIRDRLPELN